MRKLATLLILLATLSGCAHRRGNFDDGRYSDGETAYQIGELSGQWILASRQPADVAFARLDLGATIYVDNSCRRYRDATLHILANHLFFGFDDIEVQSQELMEIDGREALRRTVSARLDGVAVLLGVTVIKKNNCIFDLVLVSPKDAFEDTYEEYVEFVDAFHVERCP